MASSSLPILFSFLFSLLSLSSSSSSSASSSPSQFTISLALKPLIGHHINPPTHPPWQKLTHLVSSSLARAHHLKHPPNRTATAGAGATGTPLFPRSYGGYSVPLGFGTPSQTLSFVLDTGSSLVWFPCTKRYLCSRCDFSNTSPANISAFIPKSSSSVKLLGCSNPKCSWVLGPSVSSRCSGVCSGNGNCSDPCPAYLVQYGSGSTGGILLSESLNLPKAVVKNFVVGCSVLSTGQPAGIAGFGRGRASLPSQMGLKKFSYCMVSHRFDDDAAAASELVLYGSGEGNNGGEKGAGISYTPFRDNSVPGHPAFQDYYYVALRKIIVGGKRVRVPRGVLEPGTEGNGGTIVDSGTTFTFMDREAFEPVAKEFERQMANYSRAPEIEKRWGMEPCFDLSKDKEMYFPKLVLQFKGGAKMELPLADYFSFVNSEVVCMTVVSSAEKSTAAARKKSGPSIVIGNYQQQNFYMEYDLEKKRLGFKRQICN